jgi:hypothetical protein
MPAKINPIGPKAEAHIRLNAAVATGNKAIMFFNAPAICPKTKSKGPNEATTPPIMIIVFCIQELRLPNNSATTPMAFATLLKVGITTLFIIVVPEKRVLLNNNNNNYKKRVVKFAMKDII